MGGFIRCVENYGNHWVEYRDPTDLMEHPSHMEIGLSWCQKANNKWTYNLTNLWKQELHFMTCIVNLDAYELHPGDGEVHARVLQFTHDKGWLLFKNIFVHLCNDYIQMYFYHWNCACIAKLYKNILVLYIGWVFL